MKKVLVTGSSGLVGSRFIELVKGKYTFLTPRSSEFDITDSKKLKKVLQKYKPDSLINFAAYTNVNEAENQKGDKKGDAWKVNVEGVKNLVENLQPSCHLIHVSTDMVFSGSSVNPGPYSETELPETNGDRVTWYGFTKAEGERVITSRLSDKSTIVRIIYPFRAHYDLKLDYVRKPLSLYDQDKLYPLFIDQQVSVTFIDSLVPALEKIIDEKVYGIFHASSSDTTTPFELVSYLLEKGRGVKGVVKESSVDQVENPVRYPKYGGLKVDKTEKKLGIEFGTWKKMVDKFVSQLSE